MEGVSSTACNRSILDRKARPPELLNCPRCNSTNTKFCYYNNYSHTQPRYFCKSCRRYWTEGGSLRNVPVGGGARKNKRSKSTSAATVSVSPALPDLNPQRLSQFSFQNQKNYEGEELNLGFSVTHESQATSHYNEVANITQHYSSSSYSSSPLSALELLRSGIASRGLNSFVPTLTPDSNTLYSTGFSMQELKPSSLSFPLDGLGSRYGVLDNSRRILFPSGNLKQFSSSGEVNQNNGQGTPTRDWNGVLGGGSW